jgi:hypothetical protein
MPNIASFLTMSNEFVLATQSSCVAVIGEKLYFDPDVGVNTSGTGSILGYCTKAAYDENNSRWVHCRFLNQPPFGFEHQLTSTIAKLEEANSTPTLIKKREYLLDENRFDDIE